MGLQQKVPLLPWRVHVCSDSACLVGATSTLLTTKNCLVEFLTGIGMKASTDSDTHRLPHAFKS